MRQIGDANLLSHDGSEMRRWLNDPRGRQPIPGGEAYLDESGLAKVRILIELRPEWERSREHLNKDELWQLVENWKAYVAQELTCRRELYQAILGWVGELTSLPVSEDKGQEFINEHLVIEVYERILRPIAGLSESPPREVTTRDLEAYAGPGRLLVRCSDDHIRRKAIYLYEHGHTLASFAAQRSSLLSAYPKAAAINRDLHHYIADLGLRTALPRSSRCGICPD